MNRTLRLRRLGLFSTFRFGFLLGAILNFLPAVFFTGLFFWTAGMLAAWLAGLRGTLPLLGDISAPIDTIRLLGLEDLLRTAEAVAGVSAAVIMLLGLFLWLLMSMVTGLFTLVGAAVFNVVSSRAGGLELEVEADAAALDIPTQPRGGSRRCPTCGGEVRPDARVCTRCGSPIPVE
jgi:hypothetical protein